jgi:hypothetical protein
LGVEIFSAGPPQLCSGGYLTLHRLWLSGFKHFTSAHGISGTMSGVEAAIHCGVELWFGVSMEMSPLNQRSLPLSQSYIKRQLQWYTAKATPMFSIFFHFVRGDERCRNSILSPYRSRNAPTKFGRCYRVFRLAGRRDITINYIEIRVIFSPIYNYFWGKINTYFNVYN